MGNSTEVRDKKSRRCVAKLFLWITIALAILVEKASGAIFNNAQYSSQLLSCDSSRLHKCQQDILQDMTIVSLNSASLQYPISGPPYSPKAQQVVNSSTCRLIRSNLDCLLITTPACYEQGSQAAQNTDIILRGKRFLEQNSCNDPDTTWQGTICYRSPEIRSCEERYGFSSSFATGSLSSNISACLSYQAFKYCVETHLRYNCRVHESDMINEYLIDRASDLAWRCPQNGTSSGVVPSLSHYSSANYQLNNQPGSVLSPSLSNYNNFAHYDQRPIPTYVGSQGSDVNLFSGIRGGWERFGNPPDEGRYGISRYQGSRLGAGNGEVFDRLIAPGSGFDVESSDCPNKAEPYARECEENLRDQQRLARDARDGNELQRRLCCSLFQYRDCVSRVVLDRCADSTPAAVDILMGLRRREMTLTCRGFNRDICSGSLALQIPSLTILLTVAIIISAFTLKQNLLSLF